MADENFILTLVGQLDEKTTKTNVQNSLDNISKSVTMNTSAKNGNKIQVFDKSDLEQQGRKYLASASNIKDQLQKMLDPQNIKGLDIKIDELFDSQGLSKFKARVTEAGQSLQTLNFERAKFSDNTEGFILKSSTDKDIQEVQSVTNAVQSLGRALQTNAQGWGSMHSQYKDMQAFMAEYQQTFAGKTGNATAYATFGSDNRVNGFTAEIKDAVGQTEKLHYSLVEIKNDLGEVVQSYYAFTGGSAKADNFERTTLAVEKQRVQLNSYISTLEQYNKMELNPMSTKYLKGENTKLFDDAIAKYKELETIVEDYKRVNNNGEVFDRTQINNYNIALSQLRTMFKQLRAENGKNKLDGDNSTQKLANDVQVATARLDNMIEKWKQAGIYSDDFKSKAEAIKQSLNSVNSSKGLESVNSQIKLLSENAKLAQTQLRNTFRDEILTQRLQLLKQQIDAFSNANPRAANIFTTQFDLLREGIKNATNAGDLQKLNAQFRSLKVAVQDAGLAGQTFGQRMKATFERILRFSGITSVFMMISRSIREVISNVKDLDQAMVRLKRVTDETGEGYRNIFDNAVKSAKELNASVKDIINSTADFVKLGFSTEDAAELSKAASVYNNVGELNDINQATTDLTTALYGFKMQAKDVMQIVDIYDNLGNKFAVSSANLGEIIQRSGASLAEANNSIQEAVALGTVAQTINQDSSKVGYTAHYKFRSKRWTA